MPPIPKAPFNLIYKKAKLSILIEKELKEPINAITLNYVKDRRKNSKKVSEILTRTAEKEQKINPELAQIYLQLSVVHENLAGLYDLCEISMKSINSISKKLDELPDREEFDSLRKAVRSQGKEITDKFTSLINTREKHNSINKNHG